MIKETQLELYKACHTVYNPILFENLWRGIDVMSQIVLHIIFYTDVSIHISLATGQVKPPDDRW